MARLRPGTHASRTATIAIGAAAGAANGAFGIGGPPVILFYFASPGRTGGRTGVPDCLLPADRHDWPGCLRTAGAGVGARHPSALILLPALLAGVWLGARSFRTADPQQFRRWVLVILVVLALITAAQGLQAYL